MAKVHVFLHKSTSGPETVWSQLEIGDMQENTFWCDSFKPLLLKP